MISKLDKNDKIATLVVSVLTIFGLIVQLSRLFSAEDTWDFINRINLLLYVAIAWYAFVGYKKPHGNSLKLIMLVFVALMLVSLARNVLKGRIEMSLLRVITMLIIVYIAGRLERIEQNKYLVTVVLALLLINPVYKSITENEMILNAFIKRSTNIIMWVDLCAAYFIRYRKHKEAGLIDAPKN